MIITVGGTKGGSGKTTVATNIAIFLAEQGRKVLLVDADEQETTADFTEFRHDTFEGQVGYTLVKLNGDKIYTSIRDLSEVFTDVVIDTGGRDTISQRAALTVSDVYLVPFVPRSFEMWTLAKVEKLVKEVKLINPKLMAFSLLNRVEARSQYVESWTDYLKASEDIEFIDAQLGDRVVYSHAAIRGMGINEYKPRDVTAIREFSDFLQKLFVRIPAPIQS